MNMYKKILIALLCLAVFGSFSGCKSEGGSNVTNITITSGGKKISYDGTITKQDVTDNSEIVAKVFKSLADKQSELIMVKPDETIDIKFDQNPPKKVTLYDHYINESDGNTWIFKL